VKIKLGDFKTKVEKENIFQPKNWEWESPSG